MIILAFDTATSVVTSAIVGDGRVLGERISSRASLLEEVDELLRAADVRPREISALAVGTGPGSFTSLRTGLAAARALAFALDVGVAGVSTLAALAAGAPGSVPVVDAKRREVFVGLDGETRCVRPDELELARGTVCVGDGAVRYRSVLETAGAHIPGDASELHVPLARHHAALARAFGPAELVEPLYVRVPDVDKSAA